MDTQCLFVLQVIQHLALFSLHGLFHQQINISTKWKYYKFFHFNLVPCAPGSFSKTDVEPCELCPVGHYQTSFNQKECSPCPGGKTTRGKGAVKSRECQGKLLFS
jgi:hypothetical protein